MKLHVLASFSLRLCHARCLIDPQKWRLGRHPWAPQAVGTWTMTRLITGLWDLGLVSLGELFELFGNRARLELLAGTESELASSLPGHAAEDHAV